jgi:hypothetical protein
MDGQGNANASQGHRYDQSGKKLTHREACRDKATDGLGSAQLTVVGLMLSPVVGTRQELIVNPHLEREGDRRRLLPTETELTATARTGIVAGAQAVQIIVTVLLVATSAAVLVVAIGCLSGGYQGRRTINRVLMKRRCT